MPLDTASFQAALGSLRTAGQIIKAMLDIRDATKQALKVSELSSAIIEAQSHTMSAYTEATALVQRVRELEQRIVDMEAWNAEKGRYELKEIAPGRFVYAVRDSERGTEPPHSLCTSCYQRGIKSILQHEQLDVGRTRILVCHQCGAEVLESGVRHTQHPRPRR
jgi:hypothetical protein